MFDLIKSFNAWKQRRKSLRFAAELSFHMHSVYFYLLQQNKTLQPGSCIKEAIGLLDNWKKSTENLYLHKPTGLCIEVKPENKLLEMTLVVLDIELDSMLSGLDKIDQSLLKKQSEGVVRDYFAKNNYVEKPFI